MTVSTEKEATRILQTNNDNNRKFLKTKALILSSNIPTKREEKEKSSVCSNKPAQKQA